MKFTLVGYNHTGYYVTIYFRWEVIDVRKTVENAASDGFRWNFSKNVKAMISKLHAVVNRPHKSAGYDVTSCFQSAAKCN